MMNKLKRITISNDQYLFSLLRREVIFTDANGSHRGVIFGLLMRQENLPEILIKFDDRIHQVNYDQFYKSYDLLIND